MSYPLHVNSRRVKILPNYPSHPPMPASHHQVQVLHIQADDQLPEHSSTVEN